MSEEYDLKRSEKGIGQLYPILKSKDGRIIDGFHREAIDPNWKSLTLPEIDTEEKLLIARAVSNWHRRQVSREEKAEWINGLAKIYKKQGLEVGNFGSTNPIKNRICEVTGLHSTTVTDYLAEDYKQEPKGGSDKPKISAIERAESQLGPEVVERLRKEIKKEEKLSPQEKAKLTIERQRKREERKKKKEETKQKREEAYRKKIEEETKQKLLKDKDFIEEARNHLSQLQEPEPPEETENSHNLEQFLTTYAEALKKNPLPKFERDDVQTTIDFFKDVLKKRSVSCPMCGEKQLQWRCGHEF